MLVGIVVVEMQLWVTSKTMQVDWAIHYVQSLIKKKNGNLAKVTMWMKTIGSVYYIILMHPVMKGQKGIGDVWSSKWILCCCIHVIVCSGVLYAVETRKG